MVKSVYRGVAQMARVLRLGRRGREFESHHPDNRQWWGFGDIFVTVPFNS